MIENLYDDVLSLLNESGYLDVIPTGESFLMYKNRITRNDSSKLNYSIALFSHDSSNFRVPFKYIIKNDDIYLASWQ